MSNLKRLLLSYNASYEVTTVFDVLSCTAFELNFLVIVLAVRINLPTFLQFSTTSCFLSFHPSFLHSFLSYFLPTFFPPFHHSPSFALYLLITQDLSAANILHFSYNVPAPHSYSSHSYSSHSYSSHCFS